MPSQFQWMVFTSNFPTVKTCLYVQTAEALAEMLFHFAPSVKTWTVTGRTIDLTAPEATVRAEMERLMPGMEVK